ncbi:MAG: hypothetical protein GEU98_09125 [Pseudonocardiaceae bacterium]|nr:hypothetical protein [Pseudonocardiaceae bacterium]
METPVPATRTTVPTLDSLVRRALAGDFARERASDTHASVAFLTVQGAKHAGRQAGYLNTVFSIRVGAAVGSCAVEPGQLDERAVRDTAGRGVAELLGHPDRAVRVATLDAYLLNVLPHARHPSARAVRLPAGDSLRKSEARARAVVSLLPDGGPVAVIGVVNSVLAALRERGISYRACDLKGGRTEWGEPVLRDHTRAIAGCRAVLASGMVLGNGTFEEIAACCRSRELPLVVFAQTGSAVLRELLGSGVDALSAEPYPFFWLTGDAGEIYTYGGDDHE